MKRFLLIAFAILLLSMIFGSCTKDISPADSVSDDDVYEPFRNDVEYIEDGERYTIIGYEADMLSWLPPDDLIDVGQLYMADPTFLSDSFKSLHLEGGASWVDTDRDSVRFNLSEVSGDSRQNYFEVAIDLSEKEPSVISKSWEMDSLNISDSELIEMGVLLSNIISDAEYYTKN